MVANVWAFCCASDLGLLCESSLKKVVIASYSELDSLSRSAEDAGKSSDLETNDREDASKSASIFGNSWPFIDPAQIPRITKPKVRKRRKKARWSVRRQRKSRIVDATTNLRTKRGTSSSLRESERENLDDRSTRLSVKNSSSTRSRVPVHDEDQRLSESCRSNDEDDDEEEEEEEVISQTTSETSSEEIAPVDYSGSGYSKFYSQSHAKEEPQNRAELSEYPDYFMNVLRIDNSTENNDLDTSEDVMSVSDTSRDNFRDAQTAKFAKLAERRASRKVLENKNALPRRTGRVSSRKKNHELENNDDCEVPKKKRNRSVGQKKEARNSAADNHYKLRRISHNLEENSSSKSDSRDDITADTHDVAEEIAAQKRCDCKARRRSRNFTNASCPCKRNSKNTAAAIMQDIQECINTKIAKDAENIEKTISEIGRDILESPSHKDSSRDISMEYDWVDNSEVNDRSFQDLEQSFDSTNAEESSMNVNRIGRRRKKRYRYSIDCKFEENTETAYRSVFHDCIDFDTSRSTPSLKINMEESWKSEDSSDNDDGIHSSWRRSTLESSTEECGNEVDSALLLARKIVSDDLTKDEKCDDDETLNNRCYKYHETSDTFLAMAKKNSFHDSDEDMDMKFINQRDEAKNIVTYRSKNKKIRRKPSIDRSSEDDDVKVSELLLIYLL